ncbi:MAG: acyltransferase family protein [Pseudomonadota bacterium]
MSNRFAHGSFIPSLEGMRALAVLAVLLFHLDLPQVAGGYLGVDLFFVVSGFIITRNLLGDMQQQRFVLREFYVRRFRRLFPALLVTVCVTLAAGAWLMPPLELRDTAVSAFYALFSLANIHFWLQAGYFEAAAHTRPLLHTWSLSVEEQFYLFWPFLLLLLGTQRRRVLWVVVLLAVSLWATVFYRHLAPDAVFYLLPFRVHQLMAGALIALLSLRLSGAGANVATLLGTVGLVAAFVVMGEGHSPAVGAALVSGLGFLLLLGRDGSLAERVFGWAPMQWVGQRSYALYLVHWPIVVLYLFATNFELRAAERVLLLVGSFLAAMVLHEFVEKPFRKRREDVTWAQRHAVSCSLVLLAMTLALASVTLGTRGFEQRSNVVIQAMIDSLPQEQALRRESIRFGVCNLSEEHTFARYDTAACAQAQPGKLNVAVLGDSMGADMYMLLSKAYPHIHFLQATASACPALIGDHGFGKQYPACQSLNEYRFQELLEQDIDLVVLASLSTDKRIPTLQATVAHVQARGTPVMVVGPRAAYRGRVPVLLAREESLARVNERLALHVEPYREVLLGLREALPQVPVVDMYDLQCQPECIAVEEGKLLYLDAIHFTRLGALRMGERFRDRVQLVPATARSEAQH